MALGKQPAPGRHTNLDYSMARSIALAVALAASAIGPCHSKAGVVWTFFLSSIILSSFSLSLGDGPM